MMRKQIVSRFFAAIAALAVLTGLLLTPVSSHNFSDGTPTPTATVTTDSGASGGGNTGG